MQLMELLPMHEESNLFSLRQHARTSEDLSIGYTDFVEKVQHTLEMEGESWSGSGKIQGLDEETFYRSVADTFLWAVIQEIPPELKGPLARELPMELRSRMNLYCAHSEGEQVA